MTIVCTHVVDRTVFFRRLSFFFQKHFPSLHGRTIRGGELLWGKFIGCESSLEEPVCIPWAKCNLNPSRFLYSSSNQKKGLEWVVCGEICRARRHTGNWSLAANRKLLPLNSNNNTMFSQYPKVSIKLVYLLFIWIITTYSTCIQL